MSTIYKIPKVTKKSTYIDEYWDDVLIFQYTVYAPYHGGNIVEFMEKNTVLRSPNFDGISEYQRRMNILDY